jgi:glycosyltransferase involved in cell wall biosynthesis
MPHPIHVTHVVLSLDLGGLERIVIDLVGQGRRLGQRVSVLCLERPGILAPEAEGLGARLVCVSKGPGVKLKFRRTVEAALRDLRPDVLHTHLVGPLFYAGPAARAAGVPVVVHTEHINSIRKAGPGYIRRQKMSWLWWWAARYARKFFCVSEDIAEDMARRRIVPRRKLEVVLNGINTEPFERPTDRAALRQTLGFPPGVPVVGTVGRLNEVKRQDLLLAAFARLRSAVPSARLLLVGDGPSRADLEALAARLGVRETVHFTGYQAHPERFLAVMDVFALSSRMEGLPLAILEAWAAGLPVVASAVGGVPALIDDNRTGLLFPSGDEAALASLLEDLLARPERAAGLGAAGRAEVFARYDLRRMAGDYDRAYRELLRTARPQLTTAS